jgi:hypothetical protein
VRPCQRCDLGWSFSHLLGFSQILNFGHSCGVPAYGHSGCAKDFSGA